MPTTTSTSTSTPTPPTNTAGSQVLKTFSDTDIQYRYTCAFTVISLLVHVYFKTSGLITKALVVIKTIKY